MAILRMSSRGVLFCFSGIANVLTNNHLRTLAPSNKRPSILRRRLNGEGGVSIPMAVSSIQMPHIPRFYVVILQHGKRTNRHTMNREPEFKQRDAFKIAGFERFTSEGIPSIREAW